MLKAMPGNVDPEVINKVLIPKIIQIKYPELSEEEVEEELTLHSKEPEKKPEVKVADDDMGIPLIDAMSVYDYLKL